jgi:enamine deaminase RidA (YjgF/YER057c/UK114 family)
METDGRLTFGVWTGEANTITTPAAYNDDEWHHLVATQSSEGMRLYVDGGLRGTHPQTGAQEYTGYWRIGGDTTWGPQPWFDGSLDEAAVYPVALTPAQVASHWQLGSGATPPNALPTAVFTSTVTDQTVLVDGSTSTDTDGTVVGYAWDFGDGATATGATATHVYTTAGDHTVTLTVTDDDGGTAQVTNVVTTSAPNVAPTAAFSASVVAGQVSVDASGGIRGVVGEDVDFDTAVGAARLCGINLLAQMNTACDGDLDRLVRVVKLGGFVQAGPSFFDIPKVVNGCSDLMVEALGDAGRHARSAVGVYRLPMNFAVEVDAVVQIR